MIKIVMDSGGDLPATWVRENDICVVPVNIHFGTKVYRDGVDMESTEFYRKVAEEEIFPSTSQPSPHQFAEVYRRIARRTGATDIISINLTSQLSGTHASSLIAARDVADEVVVHPFDSRSGSGGQGWMGLEAARMATAKVSVDGIMERLQVIRDNMNICLVLDNLRFAQLSGRVSSLTATLSSLLRIKPLVQVRDGMMEVGERVRTRRRAVDRMILLVKEKIDDRLAMVAVIHADAPEAAHELLQRVQSEFRIKESFVEKLSIGIAVHLGPGTVGLVAYPVE